MNAFPPISEAGILARILPLLSEGPDVEVGPGDDAAVVRLPSERLVVSTDSLVEGQDFLLEATRPEWIGHKAAVQNLADIAAMGVAPLALVVAVSAPQSTPPETFERLMAGLSRRAAADGASIVGGDLGSAPQLTLTVTALGAVAPGREPVLRSGARPGEVLTIGAPRLGRSAAGLAFVLAGRARARHDADDGSAGIGITGIADPALAQAAARAVAWHDAPEPDLTLGWGAGCGASAMMDLSDGLARDGNRIATASGVDLVLDRAALAADTSALTDLAAVLGADAWQWVLHGGEEHALLATFPRDAVPEGFRRIGHVQEPAEPTRPRLTLDGEEITGSGWDHFEPDA